MAETKNNAKIRNIGLRFANSTDWLYKKSGFSKKPDFWRRTLRVETSRPCRLRATSLRPPYGSGTRFHAPLPAWLDWLTFDLGARQAGTRSSHTGSQG